MKKSSTGSSELTGSRIVGAADAVLGTDSADTDRIFNMKSSFLLTFLALFVIGWIPTIGQAVAGYVGGRRAGSPLRAFITSVCATVLMIVVLFTISITIDAACALTSTTLEKQIEEFSASYPLIGSLAHGAYDYLCALFGTGSITSVNVVMYLATIPFAILGGVMSDQLKREMRFVSGRSADANRRTFRSISSHEAGKKMGFESYEVYSSMSVNSMNNGSHRVPVEASPVKESPVVTTVVDTNRVSSVAASATPTSASSVTESAGSSASSTTIYTNNSPFGEILHVSTRKAEATKSKDSQSNDMEFI